LEILDNYFEECERYAETWERKEKIPEIMYLGSCLRFKAISAQGNKISGVNGFFFSSGGISIHSPPYLPRE
jgi:hypothetical protein